MQIEFTGLGTKMFSGKEANLHRRNNNIARLMGIKRQRVTYDLPGITIDFFCELYGCRIGLKQKFAFGFRQAEMRVGETDAGRFQIEIERNLLARPQSPIGVQCQTYRPFDSLPGGRL